jgi:hypothetical protein
MTVTELKFHPLADAFPMMVGTEFDELVADIKAHGLIEPIVVHEDMVLDGRNRHRACIAAGVEPTFRPFTGDDAAVYVISANIYRRHLNREQRGELLIKIIAAAPEKSDRQIAREIGVDPKTIGAARAKGEDVRKIPHVSTRTDTKGRKQPSRKGWSRERYKQHRARKRGAAESKPVKPDPRVISPKLGERVGRFAHDLIEAERLLARELASIIMLPGVRERLSADLTNGLAITENGAETSAEARKAEFATLDDGSDPGPLPESLRRRP